MGGEATGAGQAERVGAPRGGFEGRGFSVAVFEECFVCFAGEVEWCVSQGLESVQTFWVRVASSWVASEEVVVPRWVWGKWVEWVLVSAQQTVT